MALVLKQETEPDADCFGTRRDAQVQRNGGIYLIRVVFTSHRDAIMFKISKTFPSRKSKTNKTILLLPIPILSGGLSHGGSPLSRFAQPKYLILLYVYGCVCTFGVKNTGHSCSAHQQFIPHHALSRQKSAASNRSWPSYLQQLCWLKSNGIQWTSESTRECERESSAPVTWRELDMPQKKSHML